MIRFQSDRHSNEFHPEATFILFGTASNFSTTKIFSGSKVVKAFRLITSQLDLFQVRLKDTQIDLTN